MRRNVVDTVERGLLRNLHSPAAKIAMGRALHDGPRARQPKLITALLKNPDEVAGDLEYSLQLDRKIILGGKAMDPTNSFILVRFAMSTLLGLGGIACIFFGYRLFRDGSGLARAIDKFDWKSETTKVSAAGMSVGSVLMLTSVGWGYFANNSIPKLELAGGNTKITSIPDLKQRYNWASAIGSPVLTKDNKSVGTITGVLTGADSGKSRFVLSRPGEVPTQVDSQSLVFDKGGSASIDLNKKDFETKYEEKDWGKADDSVKKLLNPDFKG